MARSLPNTAHAMPPSFPHASASSVTIGSSCMFPEVITSIGGSGTPICSEGAGEIVQQEELHRGGGEHNAQLGQLVGKAAASATP